MILFSSHLFFSQSLSSLRQEFLKWAVVWKRFVVSGSSSWWKFAELEPWNVAAVSEELGHSSESHCLAAGQTQGEHWLTSSHPLFIIFFLGIPFTPYATLSYNTFYVILTVAFSDPQSCPACKPSKAITSSVGQKMMKIPSAPSYSGNRIRFHYFSPRLQALLSHRRKWRAISWP